MRSMTKVAIILSVLLISIASSSAYSIVEGVTYTINASSTSYFYPAEAPLDVVHLNLWVSWTDSQSARIHPISVNNVLSGKVDAAWSRVCYFVVGSSQTPSNEALAKICVGPYLRKDGFFGLKYLYQAREAIYEPITGYLTPDNPVLSIFYGGNYYYIKAESIDYNSFSASWSIQMNVTKASGAKIYVYATYVTFSGLRRLGFDGIEMGLGHTYFKLNGRLVDPEFQDLKYFYRDSPNDVGSVNFKQGLSSPSRWTIDSGKGIACASTSAGTICLRYGTVFSKTYQPYTPTTPVVTPPQPPVQFYGLKYLDKSGKDITNQVVTGGTEVYVGLQVTGRGKVKVVWVKEVAIRRDSVQKVQEKYITGPAVFGPFSGIEGRYFARVYVWTWEKLGGVSTGYWKRIDPWTNPVSNPNRPYVDFVNPSPTPTPPPLTSQPSTEPTPPPLPSQPSTEVQVSQIVGYTAIAAPLVAGIVLLARRYGLL